MVLQLERTTVIYRPIERTQKALFVEVFQHERTTSIYWPIEHTPGP